MSSNQTASQPDATIPDQLREYFDSSWRSITSPLVYYANEYEREDLEASYLNVLFCHARRKLPSDLPKKTQNALIWDARVQMFYEYAKGCASARENNRIASIGETWNQKAEKVLGAKAKSHQDQKIAEAISTLKVPNGTEESNIRALIRGVVLEQASFGCNPMWTGWEADLRMYLISAHQLGYRHRTQGSEIAATPSEKCQLFSQLHDHPFLKAAGFRYHQNKTFAMWALKEKRDKLAERISPKAALAYLTCRANKQEIQHLEVDKFFQMCQSAEIVDDTFDRNRFVEFYYAVQSALA